jgi:hypothetical protein
MSSALLAKGADTWTAQGVTPAELAAMLRPDERLVIKLDIEGGEYALVPALGPLLEQPGASLLLSCILGSWSRPAKSTRPPGLSPPWRTSRIGARPGSTGTAPCRINSPGTPCRVATPGYFGGRTTRIHGCPAPAASNSGLDRGTKVGRDRRLAANAGPPKRAARRGPARRRSAGPS